MVELPSGYDVQYEGEWMHVTISGEDVNEIPTGTFEKYKKVLKSAVIQSNIRHIGPSTFCSCEKLERVVLCQSIQSLGSSSFQYCSSLTYINLPEGIRVIPKYCFRICTSLKEISLPSTIWKIEDYAFHSCSKLDKIAFPLKFKEIGYSAFGFCDSLTQIRMHDSIFTIGRNIFLWANSLRYVELPNDLSTISGGMFYFCTNLKSIRLPPNIHVIEKGAFFGCRRLASIEISPAIKSVRPDAFSTCHDFCYPYVMEFYKILSNIALPTTAKMENSICTYSLIPKCTTVVDRFQGLPLHELCYYHSYHPTSVTINDAKRHLEYQKSQDNFLAVDSCGMTPLHIVAVCAKPNIELWTLLLQHYPLETLEQENAMKKSVLEYMAMEVTLYSRALVHGWARNITNNLQYDVFYEQLQSGLQQYVESASEEGRMLCLKAMYRSALLFEFVECMTHLELALWKLKLNAVGARFVGSNEEDVQRRGCLYLCGSTWIQRKVVHYLTRRFQDRCDA